MPYYITAAYLMGQVLPSPTLGALVHPRPCALIARLMTFQTFFGGKEQPVSQQLIGAHHALELNIVSVLLVVAGVTLRYAFAALECEFFIFTGSTE